mmetsp:Transcript_15374/g.20294  ORF Transcript_15374/g.20294 Transcript_15374/m.20294 type:complete len:84 (-) Transcript_15374:706-957(-)
MSTNTRDSIASVTFHKLNIADLTCYHNIRFVFFSLNFITSFALMPTTYTTAETLYIFAAFGCNFGKGTKKSQVKICSAFMILN